MQQIDRMIQTIGASPYAVVIGLILTALPITAWIIKQAWSIGKFTFDIARIGFRERLKRYRYRLGRNAYRYLSYPRWRAHSDSKMLECLMWMVIGIFYIFLILIVNWFIAATELFAFFQLKREGSFIALFVLTALLITAYQSLRVIARMAALESARSKAVRRIRSRDKMRSSNGD